MSEGSAAVRSQEGMVGVPLGGRLVTVRREPGNVHDPLALVVYLGSGEQDSRSYTNRPTLFPGFAVK